jgi:8-oxo-dGTP diphosphatase
MIYVNFHGIDEIQEDKLKYVVIATQYKDKWVIVRHRKRMTWEIPAGHIEEFEVADEAAPRELFEETGAKEFKLKPISVYSVNYDGENIGFGKLYYAKVKELGDLPESEIEEIKLVDKLPANLTYPLIQPKLFQKVLNTIKE